MDDKEKQEKKEAAGKAGDGAGAGDAAKAAGSKPAAGPKPRPKPKAPPAVEGLVVSSSPHLLGVDSVPKIMHTVVMALLPVVGTAMVIFGVKAIVLVAVCVGACLATEHICCRLGGKPSTIADGSAIITGMLLALTLPPDFPLLGAVLGSVFAIAVGKQIFGGLGLNIFNPALLGRAFLQATYPVLITTWTEPLGRGAPDAVSAATPLALMKFEATMTARADMFVGTVAGSLGETSALAILIGGLFLRYKGYINWRLPLGYLGSMAFFGGVFWLIDPARYPDPLFHVLAGGAMLAAWFMVTDMVTTPVTPLGQWIFVGVAGFLAVIIRLFGGLPEGVMYSILLMNATVPLLNSWTRPRVFGEAR
ncbi:MAG TPA: RnfABCDGE type electron transport complex subunit D [Deltaproteobacteria bacterium]|nr:RnfABCDGE type electron transport complex subunit D [Deltaproteobacteria bacterium]